MASRHLVAAMALVVAVTAMTSSPQIPRLISVAPDSAVVAVSPVETAKNPVLAALHTLVPPTPLVTLRQAAPRTFVPSARDVKIAADVEASVSQAATLGITQGVVVLNRSTGRTVVSADADRQFATMSVMKLFIAADLLTSGKAIDPSVDGVMRQMISASDDDAASMFYDELGASALIERVANEYGLAETEPADREEWWGDVQTSPGDLASFLAQALGSAKTGPWLTSAMQNATDVANDGQDQNFGMNTVPEAGSKQGWGCCLSGVLSIHSVGFTASTIVVVLSDVTPGVAEQDALMTAATATVDAALGLAVDTAR